jgi:hypothetical protein
MSFPFASANSKSFRIWRRPVASAVRGMNPDRNARAVSRGGLHSFAGLPTNFALGNSEPGPYASPRCAITGRTVTARDMLCLCCGCMYEDRPSSEDRGWQGKAIKS